MNNTKELTLLYVEDDRELREQFMRVLKPKLKNVYEAADGEVALKKYEEYHPDMMLVDINLPKIDGLEVIKKVRVNDHDIKIVVLSAYSDQEKLFKAIKLGLCDYLIKPVPYKNLLALFEELAFKMKTKDEEKELLSLKNNYFWNNEKKILFYKNDMVPLSKREILLLDYMIEQVNFILTTDSIITLIWQNKDSVNHKQSLNHLFKRLRKKLPEELIENIYSEGYRITSK